MPLPGLLQTTKGPSGGGPFTPFDVAGYIAWYNSENATLDFTNTFATSFLDITGITGSAVPQIALPNQAPSVNFGDPAFNGTPSYNWSNVDGTAMDTPIFSIGPYTIFNVCLVTDSPTYLFAFSAGDYTYGGTGYSIFTSARPGGGGLVDAADVASGPGWAISATPRVFTRRFNGTAVSDILRINGANVPLNITVPDDPSTGVFSTWYTIMGYWTGGIASATGKWAATLIYDRAVSDVDMAKIENFFRVYYNLY